MTSRRCIRAMLLGFFALVVACGRAQATPNTPTPAATPASAETTYVVQRGWVARTLEFGGRISPVEQVSLYFKTSGYAKALHVKRGDRVQAGDLLAELETMDLTSQIAQARISLDAAQATLAAAERVRDQAIAAAVLNLSLAQAKQEQARKANDSAVVQATLSLDLARERLAGAQALQASYAADVARTRAGLEQAKEYADRAQMAYQQSVQEHPWEEQSVREALARELQEAKWALDVAQAQYDKAVAGRTSHDHDVRAQDIMVQQAQAELEQLKAGIDPLLALEVQQAQQALDQARNPVDPTLSYGVDRARLALEALQSRLTDARIVAPQGGEVLSLSVYPGRPVEAFKTAIVIADPSQVEVRANPASAQLRDLAEGQQAVVSLSIHPDTTWTGTVHLLDPYGATEGAGSQSYVEGTVSISLGGDTSGLKLGDLVMVMIVLEEKDDVLWLPPDVVRSVQGRQFVMLQEGGRQRRVDVALGIVGSDRVEIVSGLEEGDAVVPP